MAGKFTAATPFAVTISRLTVLLHHVFDPQTWQEDACCDDENDDYPEHVNEYAISIRMTVKACEWRNEQQVFAC
ncbi:hypothetical protein GCM10025776_02740 [Corallincola platygyrae]